MAQEIQEMCLFVFTNMESEGIWEIQYMPFVYLLFIYSFIHTHTYI
jgi:hypothetical protein